MTERIDRRIGEMRRRWDALERRRLACHRRARTSVIVALAGILAAIAADVWARRILNAPVGTAPRTIRNAVGIAAVAVGLCCYGLYNRFAGQEKAAERAQDALSEEAAALRQEAEAPRHKRFTPKGHAKP